MRIDVRDLDVNDVILDLKAGIVVPTHVTIAGRAAAAEDPAYRFVRFNLFSDPAIDGVRGPIYSTFPDGSVNLELMPGQRYRMSLVAVADAPPEFRDTYLRSIKLNSREVLNDGFEFNVEPDARMEIVVGIGTGTLSGVVNEDAQTPSINTTVVLVPDSARRGRVDAYKTATTDISGKFQIDQIAPGDYRAFAWNDVDDGSWLDPEFMRRYEDRGLAVHIEEGKMASVALQLIP